MKKVADLYYQWIEEALAQEELRKAGRYLTTLQRIDLEHRGHLNHGALQARLREKQEQEAESLAWEEIKNTKVAANFEDFLNGYPKGRFASEARRRLAELRNQNLSTWREPVTGMTFVHIRAGCFQMGSPPDEAGRYADEGPRRRVCLDEFWLGKTEVTNAQYRRFKSTHNSGSKENHSLNDAEQPVVKVSWHEAQAYANWLSRQSEYTFSLPTEAEWEHACRGGTETSRYWGESPHSACQFENVNDRAAQRRQLEGLVEDSHNCEDGRVVSAPVGGYRANGFGLHDMLGNVSEWVQDAYENSRTQGHRVLRGGNAWGKARYVRCAFRNHDAPADVIDSLGFRLRMVKIKERASLIIPISHLV